MLHSRQDEKGSRPQKHNKSNHQEPDARAAARAHTGAERLLVLVELVCGMPWSGWRSPRKGCCKVRNTPVKFLRNKSTLERPRASCSFFNPAYIARDSDGVVPLAADVLTDALERAAAAAVPAANTLTPVASQSRRRASQAATLVRAVPSEEEGKLAMLTALRRLLREHAAAVPRVSHLPVRHAEMVMLMRQLQPRCAHPSDNAVAAGPVLGLRARALWSAALHCAMAGPEALYPGT